MSQQPSVILRKWIIRGSSVIGMVGIFALLGGFLTWTSPAVIRNLLLDRITESLVDTRVGLDGLQVDLWGGISAQGLRLARDNSFDTPDFLYIPRAKIVHDKEAILEGRLAIRRIDLFQPRMRIIRLANGGFNIDGILKESSGSFTLPAWSIQQGQMIFEDRWTSLDGSHFPGMEIRDLRASGIQDASEKVHFEGKGHGDWLGPIEIVGNRPGKKFPLTLDLKMDSIALKAGLSQVVQQLDPVASSWLRHLSGTVQADLRAEWVPGGASPIPAPRSLLVALRDGSWQLPIGGIRIDNLEGELEGDQRGVHALEVRGRWKGAEIKAKLGSWNIPWDFQDGKWTSPNMPKGIVIQAKSVEVNREMMLAFPPAMHGVQDWFQPEGRADLFVRVLEGTPSTKTSQSLPDFDLEIRPQGMSFTCKAFPYPVRNTQGSILCRVRGSTLRAVEVNVTGQAQGEAPMVVRASGQGHNGCEALDIRIETQGAPIDSQLRASLPKSQQELFDRFQPTGKIDVSAHVIRRPGNLELDNDIAIRFHDTTALYKEFPYRLEQITGLLTVRGGNWFCENFEGFHGKGKVKVNGRSWQPGEIAPNSPGTIKLVINGVDLAADQDLRAALDRPIPGKKHTLAETWDNLHPTETITMDTEVVDTPSVPGALRVDMTVHKATLTPKMFPYRLDAVRGHCQISNDSASLSDVSASHGPARFRMKKGQVFIHPTGEVALRFEGLTADPLFIDAELVKAFPPPLRRGFNGTQIQGETALSGDLSIDFPPDERQGVLTEWNCQFALRGNHVETGLVFDDVRGTGFISGKHNGENWMGVKGNLAVKDMTFFGQKLEQVFGRFEVQSDTPSTLRLHDWQGRMHGGQVGGDARIDFAATTHYDLLFRATQIRLEDLSRANFGDSAQMQGLAAATLHLSGIGTDLNGLRGYGSIDVPQGKLYKLPPVLDLIKTLGLRIPDGTAFEQVHALYSVEGPMLRFQQLDLFGNAISLRGKGVVPLDGQDMSLEFRTDFARVNQFLPPAVETIPKALSEQLFMVRIHGNPKSPKIDRNVLPGLTQPFRKAFQPNSATATRPGQRGQ